MFYSALNPELQEIQICNQFLSMYLAQNFHLKILKIFTIFWHTIIYNVTSKVYVCSTLILKIFKNFTFEWHANLIFQSKNA